MKGAIRSWEFPYCCSVVRFAAAVSIREGWMCQVVLHSNTLFHQRAKALSCFSHFSVCGEIGRFGTKVFAGNPRPPSCKVHHCTAGGCVVSKNV